MQDETTANLEKAYLEHLKMLSEQKESVHYVYYSENGSILCISNVEMPEFSEKPMCMFPRSVVIDFLTGNKSPSDYAVVQDTETLTFKIKKKEIELNLLRSVSRFLTELPAESYKETSLEILYKPTEGQIRFRLNPKIREDLGKMQASKVTIHGFVELSFYFTAPHDPSYLIERVVVPSEALVNKEEHWVSVGNDLLGTSLFVRKVFPSYNYVIERKNV